ncbi:MAG: nucleotidyl transferase AbiEii/AbiGii toxin family protein [Sedimentisphaerales bacterium]|jgi:predicted nucleotidyltransferase component of viral defense system
MSIKMIQDKLSSYKCTTELEEEQAVREITQEVALAALGRTDFFKYGVFQGGTSLRIFYGLNRFSEDMDFILKSADKDFVIEPYLKSITQEVLAYGYNIEIVSQSKADAAVRKAFIKDDSVGKLLQLDNIVRTGPMRKIRIKFEVDTNPPAGSGYELKYLDFPFVSSVLLQDLPSLFAGKIHAMLCREYVKGRDWYDFIWFTSRGVGINDKFLASALKQQGPWRGQELKADRDWCLKQLHERISSLNWKDAQDDVKRFVRQSELESIKYWTKDFFLDRLNNYASKTS